MKNVILNCLIAAITGIFVFVLTVNNYETETFDNTNYDEQICEEVQISPEAGINQNLYNRMNEALKALSDNQQGEMK